MTVDKIAIKVVPTPATQDISERHLLKLSRITKLPPERLMERLSRGKSIVIVTSSHPRIDDVLNLLRSMGFSVTVSSPLTQKKKPVSAPPRKGRQRLDRTEGDEWAVGDVIENLYEVRDIKHGGMGAVYLVRHRRWNSMLAVKSLQKRLRQNEEDRALFIKEAETWIDVGFHPNIAACYYVRSIADSPRIFIEYVDGGALNEWLNRRRYASWDLIIDLMVQVSDGLHHAHTKGLVHRDVKPGNCMMTKDGVVKVTDFGLTKRRSLDGSTDPNVEGSWPTEAVALERESITAAGMGTPSYMAPEMWIPYSEVGPQADIYAFGVMFFEIACGRKPFLIKPGEKRDKLALAHVKKVPPRPSSIREDISPAIEEIILKCLNKSPQDRFGSFKEVRDALEGAYEDTLGKKFPREAPDEVRLMSDALNNRAVSLMDLNHKDEAAVALQKALEADPHHPEAVYNLGLMRWFETGDPDWEIVVKMEEVVKAPEYKGRGADLLGRCLLTLGDASRALKACEISLSAEESTESWLKPYAISLIGVGNDPDAITHLENFLTDFPNDDDAVGWLIGALVRTGQTKKAQTRIESLAPGSELANMAADEIAKSYLFSGISDVLVFKGHTGWLTSATHFPKSPLVMSAARDRTLRIWDVETAEQRKCVNLVGEPPAFIWVSPDESMVAIASSQAGAPVKLLDLESGRFVGNLPAAEGSITALGFSSDGRHILTVSEKGAARSWDVDGFRAEATYKIPAHTAACIVCADPSGPEIIIGGMDRLVKRIALLEGAIEVFDRGHNELITGLKACDNGKRILSCARDKQVISWDGATGRLVVQFKAHQDLIAEVALNPVRELAASYDSKVGIKVWDTKTGVVFRTFPTGDTEINCLIFTPDGEKLLAGGRDMLLRAWDVRGRFIIPGLALAKIRPVRKQMKSDRKFRAMMDASNKAMKRGAFVMAYTLIRDSQTLSGYERSDTALDLLMRMKDQGIRIGLHGGWKRKTVETPSGVMEVAFSPSAITFLTAQADHFIRMWSTKTGECLKGLTGHTNLVSSLRFSLNGREALSGSDDRSVRIWDLNTGRNLLTLKGHTESVSCVAYSRDGALALSASWDRTIRVYRLPDGGLVKTIKGHEDKITSADFIYDSDHVVSAGFDAVVKMLDVASGRSLRDLRGHKDRIMCLKVSPEGDLLLTGSMDGTARMWDVRRGVCTQTFEVSESGVRAVAFSPDQRFIATGSNDTLVRIWAVETGQCQREFQGHTREITGLDFASNARFVISSSSDGNVMIWELDWDWRFKDKKTAKPTLKREPD